MLLPRLLCLLLSGLTCQVQFLSVSRFRQVSIPMKAQPELQTLDSSPLVAIHHQWERQKNESIFKIQWLFGRSHFPICLLRNRLSLPWGKERLYDRTLKALVLADMSQPVEDRFLIFYYRDCDHPMRLDG